MISTTKKRKNSFKLNNHYTDYYLSKLDSTIKRISSIRYIKKPPPIPSFLSKQANHRPSFIIRSSRPARIGKKRGVLIFSGRSFLRKQTAELWIDSRGCRLFNRRGRRTINCFSLFTIGERDEKTQGSRVGRRGTLLRVNRTSTFLIRVFVETSQSRKIAVENQRQGSWNGITLLSRAISIRLRGGLRGCTLNTLLPFDPRRLNVT